MLNLPGLAGSIASVALSLAGCLVFHDTRDPGIFGRPPCLNLRRGGGLGGCLLLNRKGYYPEPLLVLQSFPFRTAGFASFNKRDALGLSGGS